MKKALATSGRISSHSKEEATQSGNWLALTYAAPIGRCARGVRDTGRPWRRTQPAIPVKRIERNGRSGRRRRVAAEVVVGGPEARDSHAATRRKAGSSAMSRRLSPQCAAIASTASAAAGPAMRRAPTPVAVAPNVESASPLRKCPASA